MFAAHFMAIGIRLEFVNRTFCDQLKMGICAQWKVNTHTEFKKKIEELYSRLYTTIHCFLVKLIVYISRSSPFIIESGANIQAEFFSIQLFYSVNWYSCDFFCFVLVDCVQFGVRFFFFFAANAWQFDFNGIHAENSLVSVIGWHRDALQQQKKAKYTQRDTI